VRDLFGFAERSAGDLTDVEAVIGDAQPRLDDGGV
jgi:hypothetical protein